MRDRNGDLSCLLGALVMTAGSEDSGRQADVFTTYLEEAEKSVLLGAFYAWFNDLLAALTRELLTHAMETVWEQQPRLTGRLGEVGAKDWILVDSETVTLPDELADIFPAISPAAGLKVHKYFSLGRNNVVDIEITPAKDHDAPVLRLDERWRGMGLNPSPPGSRRVSGGPSSAAEASCGRPRIRRQGEKSSHHGYRGPSLGAGGDRWDEERLSRDGTAGWDRPGPPPTPTATSTARTATRRRRSRRCRGRLPRGRC